MTNKKIKIALISNSCWYIYNFRISLLRDLKSEGFEVVIITPLDKYVNQLVEEGFEYQKWGLSRKSINIFNELISIYSLIKIYKRLKPDLVHHFTIKACLYGTIAAKFSDINLVINSITGLGHLYAGKKYTTRILKNILKPIYKIIFRARRSNMIFQNKDDLYEFEKNKFINENSSIVIEGSGVDIVKFFPSEDTSGKYHSPIRVLFPSRLIMEKGIIEVIRACNSLWKEKYNFSLWISGKNNDANRSSLKKNTLRKLEENKKIKILGHVENMKELYENIDIVLLPSWREGLSKALIEAAAMQRPIITTNTTGCAEIIDHGKNGILVPLQDEESIKLALKFLFLNQNLSREFGISAREKVIKNFSTTIINSQTIRFYRKIINSRIT